jgi:hypothetical protein
VKKVGPKAQRLKSMVWAEQAARGNTHEERMQWIDSHVPEEFRALVRDHMVGCLAERIFKIPTKEKRREAIDDIPLDADPYWSRSLVECLVLSLWKEQRKMVR